MNFVQFNTTAGSRMIWRYAAVLQWDPLMVNIKWFSPVEMAEAADSHIEWSRDMESYRQNVRFSGGSEGAWVFEKVGPEVVITSERQFTVDYEKPLYLRFFDERFLAAYQQKAAHTNASVLNSISYKLKQTFVYETPENYNVLRFMLELNHKVEDLLEYVKGKEKTEYTEVNAMGISAVGIIFQSVSDIENGTYAYVENYIGQGEDRFSFAAVVRIYQLKSAAEGYFYEARYCETPDSVRDNVVKFLFAREREMIKELRET